MCKTTTTTVKEKTEEPEISWKTNINRCKIMYKYEIDKKQLQCHFMVLNYSVVNWIVSKHTSQIVLMVQSRLKKVHSKAMVEFTITVLPTFIFVCQQQ
jgi:hypothetical protein